METIDRASFQALVEKITPLDEKEQKLQAESIRWILSGEDMFRITRPNIPPKHWIVYMPVLDLERDMILLGDHIKSNLWLPAGGHVDPWEHPHHTALRELEEELFVKGEFINDDAFMLSSHGVLTSANDSKATINHEDIALWYLMKGDSHIEWSFDKREFRSLKWYAYDSIPKGTESNMERFFKKLKLEL